MKKARLKKYLLTGKGGNIICHVAKALLDLRESVVREWGGRDSPLTWF